MIELLSAAPPVALTESKMRQGDQQAVRKLPKIDGQIDAMDKMDMQKFSQN